MEWIITSVVFVALLFGILISNPIPKKYRGRECTGRRWKKAFPEIPKEEIRKFLLIFVESFGFPSESKLKFEPNDKLIDIYRAIYPLTGIDALEFESLSMGIEVAYNVKLEDIWHENISLGEMFTKVKNI